MSSCKELINVQDSDYAKEVEDAAGVKPRRPGHPDDSDASSGSGSGESSSAGAINTAAAPTSPSDLGSVSVSASTTSDDSAVVTETDAAGTNTPIFGLVAGLVAVPAIIYGM